MKFNLFNRENKKGVDPNENTTPNISYYFKSLFRKLTKLLSVNLLAILQFIPLAVIVFTFVWADTTPSVKDVTFPAFLGVWEMDPSPVGQIFLMLSSVSHSLQVLPLWRWLLMCGMVVLFALLFGWWNVGFTYLMRELVNGRPIFIFSDLKHAIKRNFKQGFLVGLIDFALLFVLGYNIYNMLNGMMVGSFFGDFLYVANVVILVIYAVMRIYIYLMIITFDIKFTKAVKNALIFTVLGLKRNLLAGLWIVALFVLNVVLLLVYIPLGIILPFFYIVSVPLFTMVYAAYPVIQKYMIDDSADASSANNETQAEDVSEEAYEGVSAEALWEQFALQSDIDATEAYDQLACGKAIAVGAASGTFVAHPLYAKENKALPFVGGYTVILDEKENALCVAQVTKVSVVPFDRISEEQTDMAEDGYRSPKAWKKKYRAVFSEQLKKADLSFDDQTKIVCCRYQVVYKPE